MKLTAEGIAVIEGDTYLSADIITKGRLDVAHEELEKYRKFIPEGGVVVDVGACLGDYTLTFSQMAGERGRVHAFEPNPMVFECLQHNLYTYMDRANVELYNCGLGERYEPVSIILDRHNIGASRLERGSSGEAGGDSTSGILVRALDNIAAGWPRLDFLKIDAEGWEPLILDGGRETIRQFLPAMLIEVNTWPLGKMGFTPEDIWKRLDELGYHYEKFDGPYGDVLCLPKGAAA